MTSKGRSHVAYVEDLPQLPSRSEQCCTGADDKLVCVYELRAGPGGRAFGSADVANVENWKHVLTLKGHTNNVLDLAWSPEDRWLATCSVDNQACGFVLDL